MLSKSLVLLMASSAAAQQAGSLTPENHPALTVQECSASGCVTKDMAVTIDANWRWTHTVSGYDNCFGTDGWNSSTCTDPVACVENCVIEGADQEYENTYGVTTTGSELKINFITKGQYATNVGARVYLMESEDKYKMFSLSNKEFTFDVDASTLPCGLNGALYLVEMEADGGASKYPGNTAGAKYGVGYCDAQCPHDIKWINGEANLLNWNNSMGHYGSCCTEMDIWEANSISTAYTPHACSENGRCEGDDCGDTAESRYKGFCDKNGCDLQTYRLGDKGFYGPGAGFAVDSTQPMTVTTQFLTDDGTDSGTLAEIRRFYVQNGKRIEVPSLKVGDESYSAISEDFCKATLAEFNDGTNFLAKGGLSTIQSAMEHGMVLALSVWDDALSHMLWLDSIMPTDSTAPGAIRGTCSIDSGKPSDVEKTAADAYVKFSNIKFGDINSTVTV